MNTYDEQREVVDYTTSRKGKNTGSGKIDICPKCGRKGAMSSHVNEKTGKTIFYITHKKMNMDFYWRVIDSCMVVKDCA